MFRLRYKKIDFNYAPLSRGLGLDIGYTDKEFIFNLFFVNPSDMHLN